MRRSALLCFVVAAVAVVAAGCGGGVISSGFQNPSTAPGPGGQILVPPAPVTITISPSSATVQPSGTLTFSSSVQNATNTAVEWAVNGVLGGNLTVGTISSTGSYTAPATPPTPNSVVITATSVQDPTKQAQAVVVITSPSTTITVSASPATVTLQTGSSTVFTATVTGTANTSVTWRVNGIAGGNPTVGTISAAGVYTAPAAVPTNPVVMINATSVSDPSVSGTALATIVQRVTVQVSPSNVQVEVFLTQQFAAVVGGTTNTAVTWAVNGIVGGDPTVGTISAAGLYTAPGTPGTSSVTVTATSVADPTAASFSVVTIVASSGVNVSVTPVAQSLDINQSTIFVATVNGTYRGLPAGPGVTWHANNLIGGSATSGFITNVACPAGVPANSSCGQYVAPSAVPLPNIVTITAYSSTDPSSFNSATVLITAPTTISVTVTPPTTALQVGSTQQFAATVTGSINQAVAWSVNGVPGGNATVGTINSAGLYTAPAAVPGAGSVQITATSVISTSSSGFGTATILPTPPPITVNVTPGTVSLRVNDQLQFSAAVGGTANQTVTWQVNGVTGGNAVVGTISASGLYMAPASAPAAAVTVTAVSAVAPNPSGSASVTVLPPATISMNPTTASVGIGLGVQFFVNVSGVTNTAVTFAVNGIPGGNASVGTITAGGLYIAPTAAPAGPVTISATSVEQPTLIANATVTVVVPIVVTVTPGTATVAVGGTQQFNATLANTTNQAVTWLVNGVAGGNGTVGTISASGLYTAPANLVLSQSYSISARSVADTNAIGTASLTVNVPVTVTVSPATTTINAGANFQFNVTVGGTTNTSVTWTVSGGGTIDTNGRYTAPTSVPAGPVTVTATSVADPTKSNSATVTVQAGVAVNVTPATATVLLSATQQFTAVVTGTATTTVTWSVTGGGTINSSGLYTAPATVPAGPVIVTATSQDGSNTTDTSTVTVIAPINVVVSPASASLLVNQTQQFSAVVTGTANTAVFWSVTGGGSINANTGLYTAPATPAGPVTITATSQADNTRTGTATVTVTAPPAGVFVTVFPRGKNLPTGTTQKFTAHVIRIADQSVTWSVNGIVGGNATVGTIDASGLYSPPSVRPANPAITVMACSVQVPAACMTVNARIIPSVNVTPASLRVRHVGAGTINFSASVSGVGNTSVTWEVNGVVGGDANFGTISPAGVYTHPNGATPPGLVKITARSVADTVATGHATLNSFLRTMDAAPTTATVLPGGRLQLEYETHLFPPPVAPGPVVTWLVNSVVGGNATVGTISPTGLYTAPQTPQSVTIEMRSTVDATLSRTVAVTVADPTGTSPVTLLPTSAKVRPYNFQSGAGTSALTLKAARNQYASFQVLVEGRSEDLTGVNVSVSDFVAAGGTRINASNATIYLEKYVNVPYASRADADVGEYPDPLIPKVDPILGQARNAFPFSVNRISPAYRIYPRATGNTTNVNFGAARAASGGIFTGSGFRHFVIEVDRGGGIGTATFRWSSNGGQTFNAANVPITSGAIPLSDGVTVTFTSGNIPGTNDFNVGNQYWIFAGTFRNQPVWLDVYVPAATPPGQYAGTVTVVRAGKANVTLNVTIDVQSHTLSVSSTVPSYFGMNWANLQNAHFNNSTGPETLGLGQLYGVACLINRINCDTASVFQPTFTFNADGTVATNSYSAYDQATAPLANGSITPHGEQLSVLRLPRAGGTVSEQYFATEHMLAELTTRGWRSRVFDLSFDEPTSPADSVAAMARAALVRSVDNALRTAVTTDVTAFNSNLTGYVNRWIPNFATLEKKEYLDGPNNASRAFYDNANAAGDELWWYGSCKSHDCVGTGASPRFDNYWSFTVDATFLNARLWGVMSFSPYNVQGIFYQDTVAAYARSFAMSGQRIDPWESNYYNGGAGEGTLFYPGRPSDIGGTSHIPIESIRLKYIRDAMVDAQNARDAAVQVGPQTATAIRNARYISQFAYELLPTALATLTDGFLATLSLPPTGGPLVLPARGGSFLDPVTGNRVHVVTDSVECRGGAKHFYAYWPVWSADNQHIVVECANWVNSTAPTTALLIRDSDLAVLGNALQGDPVGLDTFQLFWSFSDPQMLYNGRGTRLFQWNPFTRVATQLFDFNTTAIGGTTPANIRLAYVSQDSRYFLIEFLTSTFNVFGVAVFDRQAAPGSQVRTLDIRPIFSFYDEGVLTKGNRVWLIGDAGSGLESRSYTLDLTSFVRPSDHGHHGHGLLPNGTPVAVKEASNKDCLGASLAGNPPGQGWKPTALILNELVNSPNVGANPLSAELFRLGCQVPGQHAFSHFSWNNTQTDRFFVSTLSYGPAGTDVLANSLLRVRLNFNASNQIISDTIDVLAPHRSEPSRFGYFALPRATCNPAGTRCLFSSSMTVGTTKTSSSLHLFIVDVP